MSRVTSLRQGARPIGRALLQHIHVLETVYRNRAVSYTLVEALAADPLAFFIQTSLEVN